MASITSLSNSNYKMNSIYGNRNVLSGLASGMDTESMIENAVSGIKLKITNLTKKRTKIEWQQEAYRSIIDKAVDFNTKYTSYSSKTNLLSNSFFNNAVVTQTLGTYKDKISASGRTSSDIKINAVKQMATAASYTVSGLGGVSSGEINGITGKDFDITGTLQKSTVSGSLTFQYGGTNGASFDISFDELENLDEVKVYNADGSEKTDASSAEKLAQAINNKLGEITYNYTKNGFQESTTADKAVKATANADGRITFSDGLGNGNSVKISYSSGDIKGYASGNVLVAPKNMTQDVKTIDYLANKELGVTFNGSTKKISMSEVIDRMKNGMGNGDFVKALNEELGEAFGAGKVTASYADGKLSLTPSGKGDTLSLGGSALKTLGFESGDSNYINTSKKLGDILGDKAGNIFTEANRLRGEGKVTEKTGSNGSTYYLDEKGNRVDADGYRIDKDGKALYDFKINGSSIAVTEDTTLESLMNSINSNADAGVKVSYSKLTNEFKFTATETGANSRIEFGGLAESLFGESNGPKFENHNFANNYGFFLDDGETNKITLSFDGGLDVKFNVNNKMTMQDFADAINKNSGKQLNASYDEKTGQLTVTKSGTGEEMQISAIKDQDGFSYKRRIEPIPSNYVAGKDAIMDVEVNGVRFANLTRSSNSFEIDGMTINAKGTFTTGADEEAVTFNTTTDSDKIIDAIRSFVEDYNTMASEIKSAYSTMPATKSDGSRYEPLTADDEDSMSETAIKNYEAQAKQGILFGDSNLSRMYSQLLNAISPSGMDGKTLRDIGIDTSYSNGMTTLSLDEDKLRSALENNPDKVRDAFTKTKESGASSNGLMTNLQNTLNTYVKNTGEPKGILIQHAGSIKAYTSINNNTLKSQLDDIDSQIERWQEKMSNQIDRYTTQFTKLEQLISQMNSQSSALAGLMGGNSGY